MRVLKLSTLLLYLAVIAFLVVLVVASFNPGCMNVDTMDMWGQAHNRIYRNWHSVALTITMTYLIKLHDGFQPVIVLQTILFASGILLTIRKYSRPLLGVALLLLVTLSPPVFYWLGFVGVDSFMACWLIFATGCLYRYKDDNSRVFFWLGIAGLYFGFASRHNGVFAVIPLLVWALTPRTWSRIALLVVFTTIVFVGLNNLTDAVFKVTTEYPEQAGFLYDMAALSVETDTMLVPSELQKPGVPIAAIKKQLDPYNDGWLFWGPESVINLTGDPVAVRHLEVSWIKAVLAHPRAYLTWRTRFFWRYLGLSSIELEPVIDSCIVPNNFGLVSIESRLHRWMMQRALPIEQSILFRPYLYMAILLSFALQGIWAKRWDRVCIAASGLFYSLGYAIFGQTANFRLACFTVFVTMLLIARLIAELADNKLTKRTWGAFPSAALYLLISGAMLIALIKVVHLARPLNTVVAAEAGSSNMGFESGDLAPWHRYQGVQASITSANKHSGSYSLAETDQSGSVYQDVTGLDPHKRYRIVAWVSASPAATAPAQIAIWDPVANVARFSAEVIPNSIWQPLEMPTTGGASGTLRIHLFRRQGSGTVYWDDVHVYQAY